MINIYKLKGELHILNYNEDKNVELCDIKRGDIFYANLPSTDGSVQAGVRPVIVIGNDKGNKYSPVVLISPITSRRKKHMPTHVSLKTEMTRGLQHDSTILLEQVFTLDKKALGKKITSVNENDMADINNAILISFGV